MGFFDFITHALSVMQNNFEEFAQTAEAGATYANIDVELGIQAFAKAINFVATFGGVKEAIEKLGIYLLSTFVSNIINLAINSICVMMDKLGSGVVNMLTLNIGTGESVFDVVFLGYTNFIEITQILGISLVALFMIYGTIKAIATPETTGERPVPVLVRGFIAGLLVYFFVPLILLIEGVFNKAFIFLMGGEGALSFQFINFATGVQNAFLDETGSAIHSASLETILLCSFILFMITLIAIRYFRFLKEICIRYVTIGMLIIFAPVAAPLLVQKSTSQSFTKFFRVIISQFILMLLHMAFLRVFFASMNSFESTMTAMRLNSVYSGASPRANVILWTLFVATWLEVATRLDNYFNQLGFSALTAGGDAMTAVFEQFYFTFMTARRTFGHVHIGGRSAPHHGSGGGPAPKASSMLKTRIDGSVDVKSVNAIVKSAKKGTVVQGGVVGRSVLASAKNIPKKIRDQIDVKSCEVGNGYITFSCKNASGFTTRFVLLSRDSSQIPSYHSGREVTIGGQVYEGYATGPQAYRFYTDNKAAFMSAVEKKYGAGCTVTEVVSSSRVASKSTASAGEERVRTFHTGVFNVSRPMVNRDGTECGSVITQYAPTSVYRPSPEMNATVEKMGDVSYWKYSINQPSDVKLQVNKDGTEKAVYGRAETDIPSVTQFQKDNGMPMNSSILSQFEKGIKNIDVDGQFRHITIVASNERAGIVCFQANDQLYAIAPTHNYQLTQAGENSDYKTFEADNRAEYTMVKLNVKVDPPTTSEVVPARLAKANERMALNEAYKMFRHRQELKGEDQSNNIIFATRIDTDEAFLQASQLAASASPIIKESLRKEGRA